MKKKLFITAVALFYVIFNCLLYAQKKNDNNLSSKIEGDSAFKNAKNVKIVVNESYGKADKVKLKFKETMLQLLQYCNIKEDENNFDFTIKIDVKGSALDSYYMGRISGYLYTGAEISGTIIYISKSGKIFSESLNQKIEPSLTTVSGASNPNGAPFIQIFEKAYPALVKSTIKPFGLTIALAGLKDKSSYIRQASAEALTGIEDESIIEPLISALKDENEAVVSKAAEALGYTKATKVIEPLLSLIDNGNNEIRNTVVNALGLIDANWRNTETADHTVKKLIASLKKNHSGIAIIALGLIGNKQASNVLIDQLEDKYFVTIIDAGNALDKIDSLWRTSDYAKKAALSTIGRLKNPDVKIRISASYALAIFQDPRSVQPLMNALRDKNSEVRSNAALALGKIKDKKALQPLITALKDKAGQVRSNAIKALQEIKDERAVQPLIETALNDRNEYCRGDAITALGDFKDKRAVQFLISALKDTNSTVKDSAITVLGRIKDENSVQSLIDVVLNDDIDYFKIKAIIALGLLEDEKAVKPLVQMLDYHRNYDVIITAEKSLKKITGQNFGQSSYKWNEWLKNKK